MYPLHFTNKKQLQILAVRYGSDMDREWHFRDNEQKSWPNLSRNLIESAIVKCSVCVSGTDDNIISNSIKRYCSIWICVENVFFPGYLVSNRRHSWVIVRKYIYEHLSIMLSRPWTTLLPYNNLHNPVPARPRSPNRLHFWIKQLPPPSPNIHLLQLDQLRLVPKLVYQEEKHKHGEQDIVDHEVGYAERIQKCRVSLEKDEEDIPSDGQICSPRLPGCFVWEQFRILALGNEGFSESDMCDSNSCPYNESRDW